MAQVFISFAADQAEVLQLQLAQTNDVAGLRKLTEKMSSGTELWGDWARSHGGQQVTRGMADGRVEVPAEHLVGVPNLRDAYEDRTGRPCSVGIGRTTQDADNALKVAKAQGGDRTVFWREEYREQLAKLQEANQGLTKAEGGVEGQPAKTGKQPEKVAEKARLADRFHKVAKKAAEGKSVEEAVGKDDAPKADDQGGEAKEGDDQNDAVRAQLVQVLLQVKQQAPLLEKIKQTNPKLYEAVTGAIQAMLTMAKQLDQDPGGEPVEKAEGKACSCAAYHFPHRHGGGKCKGEVKKDELKVEPDPTEPPKPASKELDKAAMPEHKLGTIHTDVEPVGTKKDGPAAGFGHTDSGQVKIQPNAYDGVPPEQQRARYVQVRAGMIRSNKLGTPISSRSVNR